MNFDVHPIFVHFPIALLCIATILECIRFEKLLSTPWFEPLKYFLYVVGTISGVFAGLTGKIASSAYANTASMPLISLHSTFAQASVALYGIICVLLTIPFLDAFLGDRSLGIITWIDRIFVRPSVIIILSIAGFLCMGVTGALGGAIVYGPDVDPIVKIVYHLFF